ncbi:MFS transporter [Pigmentiphaga litoralis]|uniref:MFS transporter n=1 Tax=Pigmentiphaga litoralis TaxID=516702 RepID=UPI00167B40E3|nr:MFS transporter [Pigmentiphaga litoralis]GGX20625.1 MFS transporter [Pigmentiphaga litoralis]
MTTTVATATPRPAVPAGIPNSLVLLFAFCCGAIVANIYYAQPLIELIAPDVGLSSHAASFIVSLTQVGYAIGLLFLVPLGDLTENRRLMIVTLLVSAASLVGAAMSGQPSTFLVFSMLIGFSSVSVQMMVPLAAHMATDETRGRVVGSVMSGLLFGILLSRPLSGLVADHFGWRTVFAAAAVLMLAIVVLLGLTMPQRRPAHTASYGQLIRSLLVLLRTQPVLRQRAFYQACMFAAVALFWTAVPVELSRQHGFSQSQIALFALVGAAGAFAAPFTGRLADAGHGRIGTLIALAGAALSFLPTLIHPAFGVFGLAVTAVVLDLCMQMSMVIGQREVYALDAKARSRLNSIYMTAIFIGGAVGAAVASALYDHGGWAWVGIAGALFAVVALVKFLIDPKVAASAR